MNNSALQRLARRAGVTRINNDVYEYLRDAADTYLTSVVNYTIQPLRNNGKKNTIIKVEHAIRGINDMGFIYYEKISSLPKCKITKVKSEKLGSKSLEQCAIFSKAPIESMIKTLTGMYNDRDNNYKWSKEALNNVQFALETVLDQIIYAAHKITVNSNRKTLLVQDLQTALDIIGDNCDKEL